MFVMCYSDTSAYINEMFLFQMAVQGPAWYLSMEIDCVIDYSLIC